ncbi:MAG: macro domain-containing protein [Planctomycetaceae bacterium]
MPILECPTCGKREWVPLAICEWMLDSVPCTGQDDEGTSIFTVPCSECSAEEARPESISPAVEIVEGDLLDQEVDVIVNAWNRNIIPWWLLIPQGVSGAIKRRGGTGPFKEVRRYGAIPLGGAVLTSAGRLPFRGIIHVAGINMFWRASERSIRDSVRNAVRLAHDKGFTSIAFPLIGAGSGGFNEEQTKTLMVEELATLYVPLTVKIVVFGEAKYRR